MYGYPPPPHLGSLSQAQLPSKDASPAVIGHQPAQKGPSFAPRVWVVCAKHSRHQRMLLKLWLDIKLYKKGPHLAPDPPPRGLGSLSQAQPPSKDATPAVIGHQTT